MQLSIRCFVRIISFLSAAVAVLLAAVFVSMYSTARLERKIEANYLKSVETLSSSLDNIKNTLNKGMYSNSSQLMTELSEKLRSDSAGAKDSLSQLPVDQLNLESTNKFLSQVGNYAASLSRKYSEGGTLTDEDKKNVLTLYNYANQLSNQMWTIEQKINNGDLTFEQLADTASESGSDEQPEAVTEGFSDFEEGFEGYPTLIYDGPFSDHILEKKSYMLADEGEITADEALKKAQEVSGLVLTASDEEAGKMPSYIFTDNDTATVSITKQGGFFCYMLKYRDIRNSSLTISQAMKTALQYLNSIGITRMTTTYYEIMNGMCIINFAYAENGVTMYTDLVKVGIAMDNGEIMSFDARGYINNHTERNLGKPDITAEEAQSRVNRSLTIDECRLCVIPSESQSEKYCYEISCTAADGQRVLIYINADTGEEEQILLLRISENGMLTV